MNNNKLKVLVVGGATSYLKWLTDLAEPTQHIEDADFILFTGGEDVNPSLYGANVHNTTYYTDRDTHEVEVFEYAKAHKIKCLGICRGAQFLCVMAGGKLIQDMDHPNFHNIYLNNLNKTSGEIIFINSLHHQMQYPYNLKENEDYVLLGYSVKDDETSCHISKTHVLYKNDESCFTSNGLLAEQPEAEVVYYPKIKALAIQSHPEMMSSQFNVQYRNLFLEFIK